MLLISNFILLPALLLGITALVPFNAQVKMGIVVLAITAGAPFIPWLVAQGRGDVGYGVAVSFCLLVATLLVQVVAFAVRPATIYRGIEAGVPTAWLGVLSACFAQTRDTRQAGIAPGG